LPSDKNIKILDVGCGTGRNMLYLIENGYKNVVGIEYDEDLYIPMEKKYSDLNIVNGNAEDLHIFQDESFDLVYCNHVLEHLPSPQKAISEAWRVLKKGGRYMIGIPNGRHLNDMVMRKIQLLYYGKTDHLQTFSLKKITELLNNQGFSVGRIAKYYGSLDLILDKRIKLPKFMKNSLYGLCKKFIGGEISFDILSKK
jgi:ubiquinone/menaquinone biosynthesis C-methylase UbiE